MNNRNKKKAETYLREHHVMSLVKHFTSMLLLHEPKDPIAFLVLQVENLINFRDNQGKPPLLFENDYLVNVFKAIDFLNRGSIDLNQYFKGKFNLRPYILINKHLYMSIY